LLLANNIRQPGSGNHESLVVEEPGYEVVNNYSDNEPGYEEIGRQTTVAVGNQRVSFRLMNGNRLHHNGVNGRSNGIERDDDEDVITDPGYEVVHYPESESEHGYEIISKRVERHNSEMAEPGYEVIKKRPACPIPSLPPPVSLHVNGIHRQESDLSTEPGYERVRYMRRSPSSETEPTYASIVNRYDIEEGFSERL
jgi:hypothetical protein